MVNTPLHLAKPNLRKFGVFPLEHIGHQKQDLSFNTGLTLAVLAYTCRVL